MSTHSVLCRQLISHSAQVVEALAARYVGVGELLKDTEEAVVGGRTGTEPTMAGVVGLDICGR